MSSRQLYNLNYLTKPQEVVRTNAFIFLQKTKAWFPSYSVEVLCLPGKCVMWVAAIIQIGSRRARTLYLELVALVSARCSGF